MLAANCLDAIVIATPDDLHHPMTLAALDAGLHVLCEKPLALTAEQAREMRDRARARGLKGMVFFRWRWLPHYQELKRLVAAGWIGKPLNWTFRYLATYGRRADYAWRFDEQRATGVLGDLGSHMIDLAIWLGGEMESVTADLATFMKRFAPDGKRILRGNDWAALLVRFSSGAQGIIQASAVAELGEEFQEQSIVVHGDEGRLEVFFRRSAEPILLGAPRGRPLVPLAIPDDVPVDGETYEARLLRSWTVRSVADRLFVDAILDGRPLAPGFDEGVRVQEVIDAALDAFHHRIWINQGHKV